MTVAWRFLGNRELAASYRGEALRLLFHLNALMDPGLVDQDSLSRTYPDGTEIEVKNVFGQESIMIKSPPPEGQPPEEEEPIGDLIVFYSKADGVNRVAIGTTALFEDASPDFDEWPASKWGMTFPQANLQIFGKQFSYKGKAVWYYRIPFDLREPDPYTPKGHYLFSGLNAGLFSDYLYVEATAKWYLIQNNTRAQDPFNIGNYIYLAQEYQAFAFDFNFETEVMTNVKAVYTPALGAPHIDAAGKIYYSDQSEVFFDWSMSGAPPDIGRGHDGIVGPGGYLQGLVGWEFGMSGEIPLLINASNSQIGRQFGDWPGLAFMDPYFPAYRNIEVSLYSVFSWDMWTATRRTISPPTYRTTLYPTSVYGPYGPVDVVGRAYQEYLHYPKCYSLLGGTGIAVSPLSEKKQIFCAGEEFSFEMTEVETQRVLDPGNPPFFPPNIEYTTVRTLNHKYGEFWTLGWGAASILTDLDMTFAGSSTKVITTRAGLVAYAADAAVTYSGHQTDSTKINFLPFPLGTLPFGVYAIYRRSRNVNASGSVGGAATVSDDNPDKNGGVHSPAEWLHERTLFTPYGSKALTESEDVSPWGFLDGEDFLLQSLNTSVSYGNLMWVGGDENAKNTLCQNLGTTWDRIYGVMLCPNITDEDEAYLDGYLE